MSETNVEIVRRIYEAWESGSPADSGLLDPEIEWVNPSAAIEPGTRKGVESFGAAAESVADSFEGARVDFEEFIDAGDRVVVIGTLHGRGRGSGAEVERRQGYVWTIRDGKAVRFEWYNSAEEALSAAGLSGRPQ
jgi:ketosteroid isomerase-like protein